jgi:ribonuclease BN (tRNA processing enzyme)
MFAFCYPPGKYSSFEIEEIEASTTELSSFQIDGIRITTTPVTHAVPTIGYRVELGNLSIGYSADTIYDPRFVNLSKNVDLMIHDAFCTSEMKDLARFAKHTTAEEAGKVATEAGAGALALVHFLPAYENRGNELIAEARKAYSGKIFVPREFERVDLAQLPRT